MLPFKVVKLEFVPDDIYTNLRLNNYIKIENVDKGLKNRINYVQLTGNTTQPLNKVKHALYTQNYK